MALNLNDIEFMRKLLHELVDIRAGHTFRGKIKVDVAGDIRVLQIKDLKDRTVIQPEQLPWIKLPDKTKVKIMQSGDILLPARGEYYKAVMLQGAEPVIATSQLFVLHPNSKEILPEYLSWYLNQSVAQHYFLTHRSGTSIPMLNKQSLGALQVVVPSAEIQNKIVAIQQCWEQEKQLTQQLLINREQMLNGIFQQLLEP